MKLDKNCTWECLREFCNNLPELELSKPIIWWGDERGGKIHNITTLDEDYISDGEGYAPESTYDTETLSEIKAGEYSTMTKGTPIIWVD